MPTENIPKDEAVADNSIWIKQPFSFRLGECFITMQELAEWSTAVDKFDYFKDAELNRQMNIFMELVSDLAIPDYFYEVPTTDTSLGGCDVINPYWQFCENDDIIYPMYCVGYEEDTNNPYGLGRCYAENIMRNQQVLYLQFGTSEYNNLKDFYLDAYDPKTAEIMTTGSSSLLKTIGTIIGFAGKMAFMVPWLPFYILSSSIDLASGRKTTISKYCDFRNSMPLYYSLANSLLAHFAVNLGLYDNAEEETSSGPISDLFNSVSEVLTSPFNKKDTETLANKTTVKRTMNTTVFNGNGQMINEGTLQAQSNYTPNTVPRCLRFGGIDIYRILSTRIARLHERKGSWTNVTKMLTLKELTQRYEDRENGTTAIEDFYKTFSGAALGADDFIGIKVERSTSFSESVSNSVGTSAIASQLNSQANDFQETMFTAAKGNTGITFLDKFISGMGSFAEGIAQGAGVSGLIALTGAAHFDMPEIWKDSNFTKSYSFSIKLRAPVCDTVTYFQCICVPLALILAGALPKGTGNNTFTSPMFVRAFCKGMFSVQYGIIDSINIRRGSPEYGWSVNQLPNAIDIDLTIKDLSPAMFLSILGDDQKLSNAFASNTNMQDYLLTLTGIGLEERYYFTSMMKRRLELITKLAKDTWFNSNYWTYRFGSSDLARAVFAISPSKLLKNN